ncbi:sulfotransferase family protein [Marinobacter sp. DUT-1]|uniref:sulfotransferase family protein n=1 Tax=Marinobacter sp. DUT-1 TaxID=3412037 RepID=UPI003D16FC0B
MVSPRRPDFIIIGAPRSGTTYIARNLDNHPSAAVVTSKDDPFANDMHFFDTNTPKGKTNFDRGWDWYLEQFQAFSKDILVGEKTADYLTDPDAPALISRFLPDTKLIAILRNPIERAQSHFWHSRHRLPTGLTLADLAKRGEDFNDVWVLESGFYARQLELYREYFEEDQMLLLIHEDIERHPQQTLERLFKFLELDSKNADYKDAKNKINSGSSSFASQLVAKAGARLRNLFPGLYYLLLNGKLSVITKPILQIARGKQVKPKAGKQESKQYPEMDEETRRILWELYSEDVKKLSSIIGRDLVKDWRSL